MKTFLKRIDMFGTPAKLNTFGEASFKTVLGGILTLFTLTTVVYFSYFFGTDFYHRENPRVVQTNKFYKVSHRYTLGTVKDPFMLRLNDGNLKVLDYSTLPYKAQGFYNHLKKDSAGIWQIIFTTEKAFVPCTQTKMHENTEIAQALVLSEWFCFDWDLVTELGRKATQNPKYEAQLFGDLDENEIAFFRMDVRNYRSNLATGQIEDISSVEELNKVKSIMATIKYPSAYFDADESQALQNIYKEETNDINKNQLFLNRQHMKRLIVRDDLHWMFKDVREDIALMPDVDKLTFYPADFVTKDWQNFFVKQFWMGKKEEVATRHYMKIQELGAIVGGFLKLIMTNCMLISQTYASFYMVIYYLTFLFSETKAVKSDQKPVDVSVNNYTGETVLDNTTRSLGQVKLNFFAYYFRCCRQQSGEQLEAIKAYRAADSYIKKRLDIKYLLEHFEKFDSLCEMVLTEDQKEALKSN